MQSKGERESSKIDLSLSQLLMRESVVLREEYPGWLVASRSAEETAVGVAVPSNILLQIAEKILSSSTRTRRKQMSANVLTQYITHFSVLSFQQSCCSVPDNVVVVGTSLGQKGNDFPNTGSRAPLAYLYILKRTYVRSGEGETPEAKELITTSQ